MLILKGIVNKSLFSRKVMLAFFPVIRDNKNNQISKGDLPI